MLTYIVNIIASTHKKLHMHLFYMLIVCAFVATLGQSNSSSINLEIAPPVTTTSAQPLAEGYYYIQCILTPYT